MRYYEVMPADNSYKSDRLLTYCSQEEVAAGKIVQVPLKGRTGPALIVKEVGRPSFPTKPISQVLDLPPVPIQLIELVIWMSSYYACGLGLAARQILSRNNLENIRSNKPQSDKQTANNKRSSPKLTDEQAKAVEQINSAGTYLLHGETGSGKSRVYIELTKKALAANRSVIVLTPEIGLTTQLAQSFREQFGGRVIVLHSGLKPVERRESWQRILVSSDPLVIIGPRSALFAPLKDVGLIVIDECHDSSYKQGDAPHFSTTTVAAKLSSLYRCPLILGSATPSINDYYLATSKHRPILRMVELATNPGSSPVNVTTVDLKDRSSFNRSRLLSDKLIKTTETALKKGEQILIYLNRRGTARVAVCQDCGWIASCPHCNLPLVYHADINQSLCHTCGFKQPPPTICPECGSQEISFRGAGSKAIETEIKKLFSEASVKRFDSDNPKAERLDQIYSDVSRGNIDIIVGTQTISKGLDLPRLSVVGLILADAGLFIPDFSAEERTYQQIRQVIGRVGRGHRSGTAVVQSYNPNSPLIQSAISNSYTDFYENQIKQRQRYGFPPALHLLKLVVKRASSHSAELSAKKIREALTLSNKRLIIDGPSPCFHETRSGKHFWQLVVKSKRRQELVSVIKQLPSGVSHELDPIDLL